MSIISKLFGKSPFEPLYLHMSKVKECVDLVRPLMDAFLKEETQCISSMDWGRIYIHSDEDAKAEDILRRIFGITSFSRVIETSADLKEICETAVEFSKQVIPQNGTFAVRPRRTGEHKYTSQDVANEVGSAILEVVKKAESEGADFIRLNYMYDYKERFGLSGILRRLMNTQRPDRRNIVVFDSGMPDETRVKIEDAGNWLFTDLYFEGY